MRAVADYTIGNTAVRIVEARHKIRVINVEQERIRRNFAKRVAIITLCSLLTFLSSVFLVRYQSSKTLLDKQIYSLKTDIETLEHENAVLQGNIDETKIDYTDIYKKAKAMGMDFPTNDRVVFYQYKKGTGIKLYSKSLN